jgi:hypothetical protein
MKTLAKVGIGCAGVVALASVGVAFLAPTLVREASQVVGPIQKMKRTQTALDDMVDEVGWKRPDADALSPEQLDRFFAVRERIEAARRGAGPSLDNLPRKHVRSLEELRQIPNIIRDVTDIVGAEMDAFVAFRMPPAEYHWIERLVYERWRGPLRKAGSYPVALRAAAAEVASAAAREPDARVRLRLERLATEMRARAPAAPEGLDSEIHELLLARIDDVERWSLDDVVAPYVPVR